MKFSTLLTPDRVLVQGRADGSEGAIRALVERLVAAGGVADAGQALAMVMEREREYPTGIGGGVAIPHSNCVQVADSQVAVGLFPAGLDFGADDGPATLVVLLLSPAGNSGGHLKLLARISRLARHGLAQRLAALDSPAAVLAAIAAEERDYLDL